MENHEIVEGTGGSGNSEQNHFSNLIRRESSKDELKKVDQDSGFGRSSSRISYNFLPSNHLISFANTNSGSKNHSEVHKNAQTINSSIRAADLAVPDAIHVIAPKANKQSSVERPPSCASLKGFIPSIPFEHRKFSVDSLKSRELKNESVDSVDLHRNADNYKIKINSERH